MIAVAAVESLTHVVAQRAVARLPAVVRRPAVDPLRVPATPSGSPVAPGSAGGYTGLAPQSLRKARSARRSTHRYPAIPNPADAFDGRRPRARTHVPHDHVPLPRAYGGLNFLTLSTSQARLPWVPLGRERCPISPTLWAATSTQRHPRQRTQEIFSPSADAIDAGGANIGPGAIAAYRLRAPLPALKPLTWPTKSPTTPPTARQTSPLC